MATSEVGAALIVGLLIGAGVTYMLVSPYFGSVATRTTTVTTPGPTSTKSITVTSTVTTTTYSTPTEYAVKGAITHTGGTTARFLVFTAAGNVKFNFTVAGDTYQGNLTNSLQYTVTLYWQYVTGGGLNTSGCGTFQQTIAWGSSTVTMNWNC